MEPKEGGGDAGHVVGGAKGEVLSPSELRQRRLAALTNPNTESSTTSAATTTTTTETTTSSSLSPDPTNPQGDNSSNVEEEDDDAAMQAALALSLEKDTLEKDTPTRMPLSSPSPLTQTHEDPPAAATTEDPLATPTIQKNHSAPMESLEMARFHALMWEPSMTTDNDKDRWVSQGIDLCAHRGSDEQDPSTSSETILSTVGSDFKSWGLLQAHGGPCGVLAAVQAEMLRLLLFGQNTSSSSSSRTTLEYPTHLSDELTSTSPPQSTPSLPTHHWNVAPETVQRALSMSIAMILARAALTPPAAAAIGERTNSAAAVRLVLPRNAHTSEGLTWQDLEPWSPPPQSSSTEDNHPSTALQVFVLSTPPASPANNLHKRQKTDSKLSRDDRMIQLAHVVSDFLLESHQGFPRLHSFGKPGGVLLLVMSLVSSRGDDIITSDMDDPIGTKLTSQFGHCSQELINLLLTGQAVSNVFDNTLTPSGELTCRGIQSRPAVGYLSQLESLRYCEVGGYYKSPRFPIWVVGSTSHFTVLFGEAASLKESQSDALLEKCRRAFKSVEGGEENGFIVASSLEKALQTLEISLDEHAVSTLAATLEVSGAGIILWDDFWKATSRILTGASVESVVQGEDGTATSSVAAVRGPGDASPLLLTQYGEQHAGETKSMDQKLPAVEDKKPSAQESTTESDEQMAKRLAEEDGGWGGWFSDDPLQSSSVAAAAAAARPPSPMEVDPVLSDEEYARKLQAEWNAEASGTTSVSAVSGSSTHSGNVIVIDQSDAELDDIPPLEEAGATISTATQDFPTYGDTFQLYHYNGLRGGSLTPFRVTRMSSEEAVGASIALSQSGGGSGSAHGGGSGDLEDVIRTKFPSSSINWLGRQPPSID